MTDPLPLDGIRIIAVEQYGAGPYGTQLLADLGAEVIKIENPLTGGDVSRFVTPFTIGDKDSQFFQTFNRNKKSISLDLKSKTGRQHFEDLVKTADAVSNNLRGDLPAKLG
ncbi:MAG TPA: CoA transferase, partial [Hellea balneolensis]|nr:CoA transferase [Hellea balneolensis]